MIPTTNFLTNAKLFTREPYVAFVDGSISYLPGSYNISFVFVFLNFCTMSCKNQISVEEMLIKVNDLDTYITEEDMIKFWFKKKQRTDTYQEKCKYPR